MIIPIASDHAGYEAKSIVKKILDERDITTVDYGTNSKDSVDYPDFASLVAQAVNNGDHKLGILICGTGQGMCMTANKFPRVRAALAWNEDIARLSREHNKANILCLPGQFMNEEQLKSIIHTWLESEFEGGRHQRRIEKIETSKEDN
ncbi:ribose 5-phosphate isomerase B [Natronogracilivirga saccharolytica]|uniref:Ribose 5-phosphate isomerase B n=1 Tax=Natronogracilivirga saccharolytica TaxID=2812953 RepID=A0A8J7RTV2_9BACT|nr:ribose 5-phosphate isomerase B [Natronogracilivirga saccharolytica]MBP3193799.1 ribose 5-phosphate isomerase B [Natronogracilivirga saccharolytica]